MTAEQRLILKYVALACAAFLLGCATALVPQLLRGVRHQPGPSVLGHLARLGLTIEASEIETLPADLNSRQPAAPFGVPGNTTEYRASPFVAWQVLAILGARDYAHIATVIIQAITINVIDLKTISMSKTEKDTVHEDVRLVLPAAEGSGRVARGVQVPTPSADGGSIGSINQSIRPNAAIAGTERDTDGIIGLHRGDPRRIRGVTPPAGRTARRLSAASIIPATRRAA